MNPIEAFDKALFCILDKRPNLSDVSDDKTALPSRLFNVTVREIEDQGYPVEYLADGFDMRSFIDTQMKAKLYQKHFQYVPSLSSCDQITLYDMSPEIIEVSNEIHIINHFYSDGQEQSLVSKIIPKN